MTSSSWRRPWRPRSRVGPPADRPAERGRSGRTSWRSDPRDTCQVTCLPSTCSRPRNRAGVGSCGGRTMTSITCPSTSSSRRATRMSAHPGQHPGARTDGWSTRLPTHGVHQGASERCGRELVRGTELRAVLGMVLALVAGLAIVAGSAPPVTAQEWPAAQGCKVSYWKQRANLESWGATGYSPSDKIRGRLRPQDLRQHDVAAGH